ncbi:bifunctional lysylphosphatidylglycerol flippase/synthetase MprF [Staphylococcus hyicus]|uniref:bifunctional lysylphosphatidylglycerol flippase/synthetase MprF n=1 Tax=Staphylococcus hyicus TaxID=1284 RepID=UPI00217DCF2E|nr:bifunctional lysylphosphatidylglycerol flippase/synthetase MprF [Staphylococcus hyicus]UWF55826.1 bifunctional lysylphosphatidylglycerol flippase/synthetase MprF [Staphylococcus hyicus]
MSLNKNLVKYLKVVFVLVLIVIVTSVLTKELSHIDFKKTFILFNHINRFELIGLFLLGAFALGLLSLFDWVLVARFKLPVSKFKALRVGYIINAFNNIIGFGGFIGAGVRLWFYSNYSNERKKLVKFISYILTSMLTGLSFLSLLIVTHILDVSFLDNTSIWVKILLYIVALLLPAFIIVSLISPIDQKARWLGTLFTVISSVEWICASVVLYLSLHIVGANPPFPVVLSVFIVAAISGLASFIPGGFGAFDLIILLGLKYIGIPEEKIVLALLVYRFAYYFFPLFFALVMTVFEFGPHAKSFISDSKYFVPAREVTGFIFSFQKDFVNIFPSLILSILVGITSLTFLLVNVLILADAAISKHHIVFLILYIFNVSACLILMLNLRGIVERSQRAMLFVIVAMCILIISNFYVYGITIEVLIAALILAPLVFAYRKSHVLKRAIRIKSIFYIILVSVVLLLLNQHFAKRFLDAFNIQMPNVDYFVLRSTFWLSIIGMSLIVGIIIYIFERHYRTPLENVDLKVGQNILGQYGGHNLSHLLFSGDKNMFVNEAQDAFIMYRFYRNSLIVLGDPVGNEEHFAELLEKFYDHASYLGAEVIFYQVSEKHLSLYHDFGNQFFKLGEEALIDAQAFTTSGKKRRGFRATLNKVESMGYTFEMLQSPVDEATFNRLKEVSDDWLGQDKEFYFSVGHFSRAYLDTAPIAVLKNEEGRIDAFCTLMPVKDKEVVSVDLIRWDKSIDVPFMDALYLHMLQWSKENGYAYFNMGMATLSNVGQMPYGHLREKFAGRLYEHFNGLYSFQGLRKYKSKFNPNWESRFLVYHRRQNVWESLIKVTRVIRKNV